MSKRTQLLRVKHEPRLRNDLWNINPDSRYDQNVLHKSQRKELGNTCIQEKSRTRTLERQSIKTKPLHVENLGVFFGCNVALKHINFMVEWYQGWSVCGENGAGKTVLIKAILGIYFHQTGNISSFVKQPNQQEYCIHAAYSAQVNELVEPLTVLEAIEMVLHTRGLIYLNVKNVALALCRIFNLYNFRLFSLASCSLGVRKRLSIAIALTGYADLVLLDDPFSHLDIISQNNIHHFIEALCRQGYSVVYTCSNTVNPQTVPRIATLSSSSMTTFGERQELMGRNSTYYVVEAQIDSLKLSDRKSLVEVLYQKSQFNISNTDVDGTIQSWPTEVQEQNYTIILKMDDNSKSDMVHPDISSINLMMCRLIEKIFPHAIVKTANIHTACFWLSNNMYSMSQILKTLESNKHILYSFSIASPTVSSTQFTS
ncbi:putative ABC transporter ATP-binding protein BC_2655 isoform X2 [Drosophila obscura]|uniref:putative ABC transporter ATP-binding protein BC_2655 isoform X2 n=1 Tax=Drosophila obscura TaxID=7282 RepID=UPI000BA142C0|nr:putative ABC transporter ATP-binding protein BC_2655 isoform X2 [Drosophila obscura]